jgi:hypothetical protein
MLKMIFTDWNDFGEISMSASIGRAIWWIGVACAIFLVAVAFRPVILFVAGLSSRPFDWFEMGLNSLIALLPLTLARLARYILMND